MLMDAFRQEFEQESAQTRRVLERVPSDKLDWRPHEKSFNLGELATHVANLSFWTTITVRESGYDLARDEQVASVSSQEELLALFDRLTQEAKDALAAADDASLQEPWRLHNGETTYFEMPRGITLRTFAFNHIVHHRGQLTVYLRMLDVPLPGIYGPSADEMP